MNNRVLYFMGVRGGFFGGIFEVLRIFCGLREGVNYLYLGRDFQGEVVCFYREKVGGQFGLVLSRIGCGLVVCFLGDGVVCSYRFIVDYIDAQFENYLQEELKIRRLFFDYYDIRIYVCFYFITFIGYFFKFLDLVIMKKLDSKVCIFYFNLFYGFYGFLLR